MLWCRLLSAGRVLGAVSRWGRSAGCIRSKWAFLSLARVETARDRVKILSNLDSQFKDLQVHITL
jgi:hypothetical protein